MVELLLRQNYQASDTAAASDAVQAVFGVGTVTTSGGDLAYLQQSLVDDGISATRITSTGDGVRVQAEAAPELVVLAVRDGVLELQQTAGVAILHEGDLGLICLGSAAEMRWNQVTVDAFSFPPASVGRLLGSDAKQLRLHCARLTPRSATLTDQWHRTSAALTSGVLQSRELFESDIIREQAIDALLAVAIEAFGISDTGEDDRTADELVLAQADTFMRTHLSEPITIPDVARAAGASLRGLQVLFQRGGDGTPLQHLRGLRMTAAHETLTKPGAITTTTVGTIARDLAYTNLGRFAAHYREAFGENPLDTLRRTRPTSTT